MIDSDAPVSSDTPAQLDAVIHWRTRPPFAADVDTREGRVRLLANMVVAQLRSIDAKLDEEPFEFLICSTVLSGFIGGSPLIAEKFFDLIEEGVGHRPSGIVQTYMCTGWAYALRFIGRHTTVRRALIVLVDVELDNLRYHLKQSAIGTLGFGVSTLLFSLPEERGTLAQTGGPFPDSAFKEFVMAVRSRHAKQGRKFTFGPFLKGEMGNMLDRLLGPADQLAPNRNEELGHCFGADPFIGIIDRLKSHPLDRPEDVTAGAIAFNGYYAVCTLRLHAQTYGDYRAIDATGRNIQALVDDHIGATAARCPDPTGTGAEAGSSGIGDYR